MRILHRIHAGKLFKLKVLVRHITTSVSEMQRALHLCWQRDYALGFGDRPRKNRQRAPLRWSARRNHFLATTQRRSAPRVSVEVLAEHGSLALHEASGRCNRRAVSDWSVHNVRGRRCSHCKTGFSFSLSIS